MAARHGSTRYDPTTALPHPSSEDGRITIHTHVKWWAHKASEQKIQTSKGVNLPLDLRTTTEMLWSLEAGVVSEEEKKSCILTDTYLDTSTVYNPKIGDIIEMKLKLPSGSFCKRKNRKPRSVEILRISTFYIVLPLEVAGKSSTIIWWLCRERL